MNKLLSLFLFLSSFCFSQNSGRVVYHQTESFFDQSYSLGILEFEDGKQLHYDFPMDGKEKAQKIIDFSAQKNFIFSENGTVFNALDIDGKTIVGAEPACQIQWNITNEEKQIQNFTCQKAVGKFRGREYVVWFSPEIPAPYGPWKLGGLPSLILEAKDTENHFLYTVSEITIPYENTANILLAKDKITAQKQISYQEAIQKKHDFFNELSARAKASMPKGVVVHNEKGFENFGQEQNLDCD